MNHHRRPLRATPRRAQRGAASPRIFAGFLAVAGFFLFTEHRAHLMGALPFVLLALCPLMHLFHGRHGRHGHGGGPGSDQKHGTPASGDVPGATPPAEPRQPHTH